MRGKESAPVEPPVEVRISEEQFRCLQQATQELCECKTAQEQVMQQMISKSRVNNLPSTGSVRIIRESADYINEAHKFFNSCVQALKEVGRVHIEPIRVRYMYWGDIFIDSIGLHGVLSDCRGDDMYTDNQPLLCVPNQIGHYFLVTLFGSDYPKGGWVESTVSVRQCEAILGAKRTII